MLQACGRLFRACARLQLNRAGFAGEQLVRSRVHTSKTTNKFSPEVRARAVPMVTEHEAGHSSRWAAVLS